MHQQGANALWATVCSSPAPRWIAPSVVSPRQAWNLSLRLYAPGVRSKAAAEPATRINTEGFACPNPQCAYFGITDARVHALVGDGKHGHAERIQTFGGPACRPTFTSRRTTALYRLKTPSHQIAVVLSARVEGLDPSAAQRVFGFGQAPSTSLSHSRRRAGTDLARTLLPSSADRASAVG
jgi:hypothetical protein